nr:MAG TPA: hypothetical protein [Microviridae sp.]
MKTFNFSEMELVSIRIALSHRLLNLKQSEKVCISLDLPHIAVHSEISLIQSILSRLS